MTEDEYEALPVKSNDVIYVVTMNDLSINMYQGSKQISGGGGGGGSGATFQVLTRTQWKALQNKEEGTFYVVTDVIGGPPGLEENVYSLYFGSYLLCNSGITSNEDSNLLYSKEFKFGANDKSSVKLTMRRSGRVIWYNFWCRFISTSDYEDLVSKINNDNSIFSDIPSMFISNDSASFPIPLTDAGYAASASLNTPTFVMTSNPYEIPHKFYLYNTYQFNSSYIRLGFQNWTGCMLSMRDTLPPDNLDLLQRLYKWGIIWIVLFLVFFTVHSEGNMLFRLVSSLCFVGMVAVSVASSLFFGFDCKDSVFLTERKNFSLNRLNISLKTAFISNKYCYFCTSFI